MSGFPINYSNYPPGVTDNDPYLNDEREPDESDESDDEDEHDELMCECPCHKVER